MSRCRHTKLHVACEVHSVGERGVDGPCADHLDPSTGRQPVCNSLCLIEALRVRWYGNVVDAHTHGHLVDAHHSTTPISVNDTRVGDQVHPILNHDLPEGVTVLSLMGFGFEKSAITSHL